MMHEVLSPYYTPGPQRLMSTTQQKIHLDGNKNSSSLKSFNSSKVQDSKYLLRFKAIFKLRAPVKPKKKFVLSLCDVKSESFPFQKNQEGHKEGLG